jgi:hypothetical protein
LDDEFFYHEETLIQKTAIKSYGVICLFIKNNALAGISILFTFISFLFLTSCNNKSSSVFVITETPFLPESTQTLKTNNETTTPIPTFSANIPSIPPEFNSLKIDGITTTAEFDAGLNTWIWKDKKGAIRRVLDPLTQHLLARTTVVDDRLTYDIDYAFRWEVNLVNYDNYSSHAPFGSAYIKLLKSKYPAIFADADENTGIVFRIIQSSPNDLPAAAQINAVLDKGNDQERFFLKPAYIAATDEYILTLFLKTDFLTRKGAINTYTDELLNYCVSNTYPDNPSGSWGIEVYKHAIK